MDITERQSRHSLADSLRPALANQGVVAVSTTFVDNAGITGQVGPARSAAAAGRLGRRLFAKLRLLPVRRLDGGPSRRLGTSR